MSNDRQFLPGLFGFVGRSGAGKTTLLTDVTQCMRLDGFSVSAIKRAHDGFDLDTPGKDSWRLREAGCREVMDGKAVDRKTEERRLQRRLPPRGSAGCGAYRQPTGRYGYLATYELLRKAGNNGVQLPVKEVQDGKLIGTQMDE